MRLCVAAVAGAALLVGCTAGAVESPEPEGERTVVSASPSMSPSVSVSPSASPSPSPTTFESYPGELPTEDAESAAIIAGWQEYHRVLRKFSADPLGFSDFSETQYVTADEKQNGILDQISGYREQRIRVLGDFKYDQIEVGTPQERTDGLREATLNYCVDRSGMKVVDYEGNEALSGDLSPTYPETAILVEGPDRVWRVSQVRNDQESPC